jgi:hypothetical protein
MSTWTEIAKATKPAGTYVIDSDDLDRLLIERIARQDRTAMQQPVRAPLCAHFRLL